MFVDEAGWGWPKDPPPKAKLSKRGERAVLWLILANALLLLIAPIGGGTIIEPIVTLFSHLR